VQCFLTLRTFGLGLPEYEPPVSFHKCLDDYHSASQEVDAPTTKPRQFSESQSSISCQENQRPETWIDFIRDEIYLTRCQEPLFRMSLSRQGYVLAWVEGDPSVRQRCFHHLRERAEGLPLEQRSSLFCLACAVGRENVRRSSDEATVAVAGG
jgi:hypothetical protein